MKLSLILLLALLSTASVKAADYAYFGFEPSIVTNYVAVKKKMGYVRLTVELMIEDASNYEVKSINGRHEIQRLCEERVKQLLEQETGKPLIKKLLFTQWLDN